MNLEDIMMQITEERGKQLEDINRWIEEFNEDKIRGTLTIGIGTNAARNFDILMRNLLEYYCNLCNEDHNDYIPSNMKGKPINKYSLGQVELCFRSMSSIFSQVIKGGYNRFPDDQLLAKLKKIIKIRNSIQHPGGYGKNLEKLESDIVYMLILIKELLQSNFFCGAEN